MNKTGIEYLDYTWNVTHGCTPVSAGCAQCWAKEMSIRLAGMNVRGYDKSDPFKVVCCPWKLDEPLKVKKPSRIGVSFMGDPFHSEITVDFLWQMFDVINSCDRHTYLILTKRPELAKQFFDKQVKEYGWGELPNHLWLGVTAENQEQADKRIPILLQIPAAVRFVSIEPMLGEVKLSQDWVDYLAGWDVEAQHTSACDPNSGCSGDCPEASQYQTEKLDWVIVGAESGQKRRECDPHWIRDIAGQCQDSDVPIFIKQMDINGKLSKDPADWPEHLRIQRYPNE